MKMIDLNSSPNIHQSFISFHETFFRQEIEKGKKRWIVLPGWPNPSASDPKKHPYQKTLAVRPAFRLPEDPETAAF